MNCLRCGHTREPGRRKWCALCAPIMAAERNRRWQHARYHRLQATANVPCQRCGLPRGPRRWKWCGLCAVEVAREQHIAARDRYRAKRPDLVVKWQRQAYEKRKRRALAA